MSASKCFEYIKANPGIEAINIPSRWRSALHELEQAGRIYYRHEGWHVTVDGRKTEEPAEKSFNPMLPDRDWGLQ